MFPRAGLFLASFTLAALLAGPATQPALAQIAPYSSGNASAANSPAAAVQTGYRRQLSCADCAAETAPQGGGESGPRRGRQAPTR